MHFLKKKRPEERFFNYWAKGYENSLRSYDYIVPDMLFNAVWPYVSSRAGQGPLRLLDIGIGTGLTAKPFRETGKAFITGIDVSQKMIAECRRKGWADELHHMDATCGDLPFAAQSFDVIIAGGAVEFMEDTERLFEEISRLIRPGGIVALTHEVPETKKLYPPGMLGGVLEDEKDRVVIQRSFLRYMIPRAYQKYLYSPRLIEDRFIVNDLPVLESKSFTAYQWAPDRKIIYNMVVGQRFL